MISFVDFAFFHATLCPYAFGLGLFFVWIPDTYKHNPFFTVFTRDCIRMKLVVPELAYNDTI